MKLSVRARALVVMATSASLLGVPLAMPSSAATGAQCKKLSDTTKGSAITFHVASCTPVSATGGSGSGPVTGSKPGQTSGTLNVTVTWAQKKGTTKAAVKFGPATGPGKCPVGTTRLKITGKITGGSGMAFKTITKNQPVSASVCVNSKTQAASLEPGTTAKF
jgi:hypothetical protein